MKMSGIKRIVFLAIAVCLVVAAPPMRVRAAVKGTANKKPYVREQCIVVPVPGASIDRINEEYGSTTVAETNGIYLVQLPAGAKTAQVVRDMRAKSSIQAAGTNTLVASPNARRVPGRHQTETFPNDVHDPPTLDRTGYDTNEYLEYLKINEMSGLRGQGATIAVIDTGVDLTHPDLVGRFALDDTGNVLGADFVDGGTPDDVPSTDPDPDANAAWGHGTFIAGIIAKIAPDARIMPIRALGPDGVGTAFAAIEAVDFAREHGANVISMSFGAPEKLDGLDKALAEAHDGTSSNGSAVLVAAAGNSGTDRDKQYPAVESFVLAVAAVDAHGVKTAFSNYGSLVDLAAPGDHIVSTFPGGQYTTWSGTSFATPMVAATAALVVAHRVAGTGMLDRDMVKCVENTVMDTARSLDAIPANNRFRGKIGRLVDPAAAFESPGCANTFGYARLTPIDPKDRLSNGEAEYKTDGVRQELEVSVGGLQNGQYTLRATTMAGAIVVDTFSVSRGEARVEYSTEADGNERLLPDGLRPVTSIRSIEIVRPNGSVVIAGSFTEVGGDDGGGGGDDGGGDDGGGGNDGGGGGGGSDDGGGGSGGSDDGGSATSEQTADLSPVGSDPDAYGQARWRIDGSRQRFDVEGENLTPGTSYDVWANGMLVGSFTADSGGKGDLSFDSDHAPLPYGLDPVTQIQTVEVRDASGVVLAGSF